MKHTTLLITVLLLYACGGNNPTQESHFEQEDVAETYIEIEESGITEISKESSPEVLDAVTTFIDYVKAGKETLSEQIIYPLHREYPIPPIANKKEFLRRYDEVFDEALLKMITDSNIETDWSEVGWRGIMLNNGDVWITTDSRLICINYQSYAEMKKMDDLILADRNSIHESLRKFDKPVCSIETENYKIRIDDLGDNKFRYASWKIGHSMSDKPDLIITNGFLQSN